MKLLWTARDNFESKTIQWCSKGDCSHFAALFYESTVPIVFQSNFLGVDFSSYKAFLNNGAKVIHSIDFKMDQKSEDLIFDNIVESMVGQGYDYKALIYAGLRSLAYRVLNIPLPKTNKWASKDQALCVELAMAFPDNIVPASIKSMDISMMTPIQLYNLILEARK